MARVSTYLNFKGNTEEAFNFYRSVFGTEFLFPIDRMGSAPDVPGVPPLSEREKNYVLNVQLPITAGHVLMGTDALDRMGELVFGDNVSINVEPDTLAETQRVFDGLSQGATNVIPLQKMFWGGHYATLTDKFGVRWMFNCASDE